MKNHTDNEKRGSDSKARIFQCRFGGVVFFEKTGATFLVTKKGQRDLHGAEKRIILSLLGAIEEARRRPLPVAGQN